MIIEKDQIVGLKNLIFANGERNYKEVGRLFKLYITTIYNQEPDFKELIFLFEEMLKLAKTEIQKKVIECIKELLSTGIEVEDDLDGDFYWLTNGEIIVRDFSGAVADIFSQELNFLCLVSIESEERKKEIEVCASDIISIIDEDYLCKVIALKGSYLEVKNINKREKLIPFYKVEKIIEGEEKEKYISEELLLNTKFKEFETTKQKLNKSIEEAMKKTLKSVDYGRVYLSEL